MSELVMFYDGLCPLCSREIRHYRKKVTTESVEFVDITADGFDAVAWGLDPKLVHREMHAIHNGRVRIGVDCFLAIWTVVPGYGWLRRLVAFPLVLPFAKAGYWFFSKARPLLPRKKVRDCDTGACRV